MNIRKTLLALLTLSLLFSLMAVSALAEKDFTELYNLIMGNADDYVILDDDYVTDPDADTITLIIPSERVVTLDLNGHTIDRNLIGKGIIKDGSAIIVEGTLTIIDSSQNGGGKITGGNTSSNGGGVMVRGGGHFTLAGGTISGNYAGNDGSAGGGVYVAGTGSTFTLAGGTITDNNATDGAGIACDEQGTLIITSGSVTGNEASNNGGGIYISGSNTTASMTGGAISRNNAGESGGGVYMNSSSASFMMTGGSITDNTADVSGGGVYMNSGMFEVTGGAISGNTVNGLSNNVANNENASPVKFSVTIDDGITGGTVSADKTSAAEGETVTLTITMDEGLIISYVKVNDTEIQPENGEYFFTMPAAVVTVKATFHPIISYVDPTAEEPNKVCSEYTELSSLEPDSYGEIPLESGWYVLTDDLTTEDAVVTISGNVHLILMDGKTLTVDCIYVPGSNSLTIYGQTGGTGALNAGPAYEGCPGIGGSYAKSENKVGSVTINGGVITAVGGKEGAGIGGANETTGGSVTINGGTVTATGGEDGAGIGSGESRNFGSVTITGGTVNATGGKDGAGIGGTDVAITLTYADANPTTSVTASSYSGTVTLSKSFIDRDIKIYPSGTVADNSVLAGKTLTAYNTPVFATYSLVLSGQIGVNVYVALPGGAEEYEGSYMAFFVNGVERDVELNPAFMSRKTAAYGFTCYVNVLQMAEEITAVFHYGDNNAETIENTYSVIGYLNYIKDNSSQFESETVDLASAIRDYGYYCQKYLNIVNDLGDKYAPMPDPDTTEYDFEDMEYATESYKVEKNYGGSAIDRITYSLLLDSSTVLKIYFTTKSEYEGTPDVSVGGGEAFAPEMNDGRYEITIDNLPAHKLADKIDISIMADGECHINVSALSYAYTVLSSETRDNDAKNAMASFYRYYEKAMAYRAMANS